MLNRYRKEITYCTYCPKLCRFACTVTNAEVRETVTPTTKMNLMHLVREGAIDYTPDVAEITYHCTGCRLCRAYCKHRTDVAETMIAAREEAVKFGVCPPAIKEFLGKYREHSNAYGEDLSGALATLKQERRINKTAEIIYFPGAVTLQHYPGVAADMTGLLEMCGADFAILGGDNHCCGIPALLAGDRQAFSKVAKTIAEILNDYKTVVCGDPSTIETINTYYPQAGAKVKSELLHTTEWLAKQAAEKRISFGPKSDSSVMYHDPCYLAKYLNVMEPPRQLLQQMFYPDNILEFSWNRDKNYCCGGGGLVPVAAPEVAAEITRRRLEEFYEHKPGMLVTACPTCERMFERADNTIAVVDIVTLVRQQIDDSVIAGR